MFKKNFARPDFRNLKPALRLVCNMAAALLCFCIVATFSGCRTAPLPKINLSEPGWTVRHGQAVWRAAPGVPDIAGDLLLATHSDGRTLIQFTKPPFPMIVAQATPDAWQIESPTQNKRHTGHGTPPASLIWFQLARALGGSTPAPDWAWRRSPDHWWLLNMVTGESIEGYISP